MLDWIGAKEEEWETGTKAGLKTSSSRATGFDPFDVEALNAVLEPLGFVMDPAMFTGSNPPFSWPGLKRSGNGSAAPLYVLGKELPETSSPVPALTQGDTVFCRKESARLFLWKKTRCFFLSSKNQGRRPPLWPSENCG